MTKVVFQVFKVGASWSQSARSKGRHVAVLMYRRGSVGVKKQEPCTPMALVTRQLLPSI